MGDYRLDSACGWDLSTNISKLSYTEFSDQQSSNYVVLPGLPPNGNCHAQSCPGLEPCESSAGCSASGSSSVSASFVFSSPGLEEGMTGATEDQNPPPLKKFFK